MEMVDNLLPSQFIEVFDLKQLSRSEYMVYVLVYNDKPVVVGHGKFNRSKLIFDDLNRTTSAHLKALFVRLYHLYGDGEFRRFVANCRSKQDAFILEKELHSSIGGNTRDVPEMIREKLFEGLSDSSLEYLIINLMLASSFDGLSDFNKWRRIGVLSNEVIDEVSSRLKLK